LRIFCSWKMKTKDCASNWPRSCVLKTPIYESGSTSVDRQPSVKRWPHSQGYIETNILAAASPAANAFARSLHAG
ncbi:hypothetical protein, partial [Neorhizobium galegae]|uniref:hypothetical protein n=1 Tax=Neorhizobium galegae TaxID=399 RepID=UPI00272E4431